MVDEGKPLVSKALALIAKVRYTSIIHQATKILQLESESDEEWSLFVAVTSTLFTKSGHIQRLTSHLEQTAPQDTTLDLVLDVILGLDTYLSMAIQDYDSPQLNFDQPRWMWRLELDVGGERMSGCATTMQRASWRRVRTMNLEKVEPIVSLPRSDSNSLTAVEPVLREQAESGLAFAMALCAKPTWAVLQDIDLICKFFKEAMTGEEASLCWEFFVTFGHVGLRNNS
ncbi:MAG: hypothetical protein Q9202_007322 [Teloschistes flavicans]